MGPPPDPPPLGRWELAGRSRWSRALGVVQKLVQNPNIFFLNKGVSQYRWDNEMVYEWDLKSDNI